MIRKHWLSQPSEKSESSGFFGVIGWGAFLGTSWTWVIGMVLPALLIRDMGWAGFLTFAIPNCIGAAAMGTVLSGRAARKLPEKHMGMIITFSIVTVAYHFYIAGYLLPTLLGPLSLVLFILAALIAGVFMSVWKDRGALWFSIVAWIISFSCFIVALCIPSAKPFSIYLEQPLLDQSFMWFFLPASVGGFLLCPYLDATFIRARAKTKGVTGKLAFKVGFLVFFATMIVFTTAYSHQLVDVFASGSGKLSGVWAVILLVHIPLQMGLTVAWHMREVFGAFFFGLKEKYNKLESYDCKECAGLTKQVLMTGFVGIMVSCAIVFISIFVLGVTLRNVSFEWFEDFKIANNIKNVYDAYEIKRFISIGEIGYRCILILYGTLFPAYVLLMMVPTLYPSDNKRSWFIFIITVLISSFTAYLGFIHDIGWGIMGTLVVICLARLVIDVKAMNKSKKARGI